MKNLLALCLILFTLGAFGQARSTGFFKEFGIGAGVQFPSLDYYKDRTRYEFNLGIASQAFATYAFNKMLDLRVSSGYMSIKGTQEITSSFSETTSLRLIPINAELIMNFRPGSGRPTSYGSNSLSLFYYAGVGGGYNFLTTTYQASGNKQSLSGGSMTTHGLVGVKAPVGSLVIGLEGQYVLGSYDQAFQLSNGNEFSETISINGPRVLISVAYPFGTSTRKTGLHSTRNYYRRK